MASLHNGAVCLIGSGVGYLMVNWNGDRIASVSFPSEH